MVRFMLYSALLVAAALPGSVDAADPRWQAASSTAFLRLAILDASSSMEGERLDVARNELFRVARQLPPSKTHPFVIVPFDSDARQVCTFTDLPSMEAFLSDLTSEGGTSIAAGLARAVDELSRYAGARNVYVFLYTDGEDSSEKEIAAQEARLDAIFADRQTKGLESRRSCSASAGSVQTPISSSESLSEAMHASSTPAS